MRRWLIGCLLLATICGCTHIQKDDRWVYDGVQTSASTQSVRVESMPSAFLWLDGKYAGKTPLEIPLESRQRQIRLIKRRYRNLPGGKKEIIEQEEKTETVPTAESHTLLLKAPGYHDSYLPLNAASEDAPLHIRLTPKSGISHPIACEFTVQAEKKDGPLIQSIFSAENLSPGKASFPASDQMENTDMMTQVFRITVKDADALADLMGRLHAESRKRHFLFNVRHATAEARFSANPTREFRAVWISYIDWPREVRDPAGQKKSLTGLLDAFKRLHFNTVFFQVRPACDALYPSKLAPWSALLTGKEGKTPGYDPLGFIIEEAHKRGLALHAWINPFRASVSKDCRPARSPHHILNLHPDWALQFHLPGGTCFTMLNPGIPEVREHITAVAEEIVRHYDVDGIHFDDFFYPYPQAGFTGVTDEDRQTFQKYGKGFRAIGDWRRSNINRLIGQVNQRIKQIRKNICFGISPFGIWKNKHPPGVTGIGSYDAIYADSLAWLKQKSVDYLTPQLYWKIGGSPDYEALLKWWAEQVQEARGHVYPGQIVFYVGEKGNNAPANKPVAAREIIDQIFLNREYRDAQVLGSALFRATNRKAEVLSDDSLKAALAGGIFATPALPPVFPWLDASKPAPPDNLTLKTDKTGQPILTWEKAASGEPAFKYAIYAVYREDLAEHPQPVEALGHLIAVTGETKWKPDGTMPLGKGDRVFVTALSRNNVESPPGKAIPFASDKKALQINSTVDRDAGRLTADPQP